ncbi:DUF2065 domain-containing protein [Dokdonella sp. MW10]|uniref:DUF2065 domain-containing protein n=1 Tax=Dokdonella sp. MW10 TaxID=2992926 RepID=UPI003F7D96EE
MPGDLLAALCLVAVIEGLFLFAAPSAWRRMAEQVRQLDDRRLRVIGAVLVACGLAALALVR